jgi:cell wall-associated NlpC family hydrolase
VATVRQKIVAAARWGIAHEPRIHYGEIRPVPLGRTLPLTTDCSGFVTLCYFLAGAPDPNGLDYSGEGWTGTLLRHLEEVEQEPARRGDLVVWGAYPGRHVAIVLEPGDDPLLCSHGQERGPLAIRLSDEQRIQQTVVTWLDGLTPDENRIAVRAELEGGSGRSEDGVAGSDG